MALSRHWVGPRFSGAVFTHGACHVFVGSRSQVSRFFFSRRALIRFVALCASSSSFQKASKALLNVRGGASSVALSCALCVWAFVCYRKPKKTENRRHPTKTENLRACAAPVAIRCYASGHSSQSSCGSGSGSGSGSVASGQCGGFWFSPFRFPGLGPTQGVVAGSSLVSLRSLVAASCCLLPISTAVPSTNNKSLAVSPRSSASACYRYRRPPSLKKVNES